MRARGGRQSGSSHPCADGAVPLVPAACDSRQDPAANLGSPNGSNSISMSVEINGIMYTGRSLRAAAVGARPVHAGRRGAWGAWVARALLPGRPERESRGVGARAAGP